MNSSKALGLMGIALSVAACGGHVVDASDGPSTNANASDGPSTEVDDAAASVGVTKAQEVDGGTGRVTICPAPPPPTSTPQLGCSTNDGGGWVAIPCLCELWTANSTPAPVTTTLRITLVTSPDDGHLGATNAVAEVTFDDPDASWFAAWTKQPQNGSGVAVAHEGDTTTVSIGEGGVTTMTPVAIPECTTRKARTRVAGGATVSIIALLDNGLPPTMDRCSNPPLHPPPPPDGH